MRRGHEENESRLLATAYTRRASSATGLDRLLAWQRVQVMSQGRVSSSASFLLQRQQRGAWSASGSLELHMRENQGRNSYRLMRLGVL